MRIFTKIKELINNTINKNGTIDPKVQEAVNEAWDEQFQRCTIDNKSKIEDYHIDKSFEIKLPRYCTYDKTNDKFRIRKDGIYYGVYNSYDSMMEAYDQLNEYGWDRRIGYDLPLDSVGYNPKMNVFTLFYSDGENNYYEEYKQARSVKKRLEEIQDKEYYIFSPENHKKSKREYYLQYHYITRESLFRLPGKSGVGIKITAQEAFKILKYYQEGKTVQEIFNLINFKHDIHISTVENWLRKYEKGLMNISLAWIIDNNIIVNPPSKSSVLKKRMG